MKTQQERVVYFIVQCLLFLVSPLLSLILCAVYYKEYISQFFFILFAFYFGYQTDVVMDLANHYSTLKYFVDPSVNPWTHPYVLYLGKEPFHFIFKYIVSFFSTDSRFFAGVAAATYAFIFLSFFNRLRPFYLQKMSQYQVLALCGIVFCVEYFLYLGLRYWNGAFFFLCFYLQYVLTNKNKYLFFSFGAILFHFVHIFPVLCAIATVFFGKNSKIKYIILSVSLIVRFFGGPLIFYFLDIFSSLKQTIVKDKFFNSNYQEIVLKEAEWRAQYGNIVYENREYVSFTILSIVYFLIWKRNKQFYLQYNKFYSFVIYMFSMSNFVHHSGEVLDERITKFFILSLFVYLFLILNDKQNLLINKNNLVKIIFMLLIIFIALTAIVEQRKYLFDLIIWVGNPFVMQ